jgi:hypothetical protein
MITIKLKNQNGTHCAVSAYNKFQVQLSRVMEWLVSNIATWILIHTYKLWTANKTLLPLHIFFSRNPWHPFVEPSLRNTGGQWNHSHQVLWLWWLVKTAVCMAHMWLAKCFIHLSRFLFRCYFSNSGLFEIWNGDDGKLETFSVTGRWCSVLSCVKFIYLICLCLFIFDCWNLFGFEWKTFHYPLFFKPPFLMRQTQ